jgi:hypothetical protein
MYAILASFVVYGGLSGPPIPQQPPAIQLVYDEGCGSRCREHRAERQEHEHEHRGS